MRITFVAGDLTDGGGVNRVISDLSAILADQLRATVKVIAVATGGPPAYPISSNIAVETRRGAQPIGWKEAISRVRREMPDFVIGSWTQPNFMLILGLLLSNTRVIVVEHTSWHFHPRRVRALRRLLYPLAWRVLVLNPAELRHYRAYLRNVRLMPNPVPADPTLQRAKREKLIVAVGHLEGRKNFIDAVRAMALSGLEESGWRLAIIGAGPEKGSLLDAIRAEGLTRTEIVPPTADLSSWFRRASLTLVTAKLEVFSLVLAEAMSAGVVPIAYGTDGPSFILEDFPDHVVPVGDVDGLASRMRRFADVEVSTSLRRDLASAIKRRFAPEVIAEEWRRLLEQR